MPQTKMVFIYKVIATESEMDIYVTDLAGQKAVVLKTLMDRIRRRDEDGVLWIPFRRDCRFVSLVTHSRPNSRQPKTTDNQGFTHVIKSSRRSLPGLSLSLDRQVRDAILVFPHISPFRRSAADCDSLTF
jgi:hypothetical protein